MIQLARISPRLFFDPSMVFPYTSTEGLRASPLLGQLCRETSHGRIGTACASPKIAMNGIRYALRLVRDVHEELRQPFVDDAR